MPCGALSGVDFMTWFRSLSDEEQCEVQDMLQEMADELGVVIEDTSVAQNPFDLFSGLSTPFSLN